MQMREKVGKSRFTVFFQWFVALEGWKVGSLKRRVRSHLMRDEKLHAVVARSTFPSHNCTKHTSSGPLLAVEMSKKLTPLWREAHFQVITVQNTPAPDHFWQLRCRKSWRRCGTKHISKSKCTKHILSDHFWKLQCRKSARRCGAKHISKSKCTKHTTFGPLLEVAMSKKCTTLWREAHFEVKRLKTPGVRTTFGGSDVEKVHAVVARSTFRSQNVKNTRGSDNFWRFRCGFASLRFTTLHYTTLHSTTLHYITQHYTPQHYNYTTTQLHSTTLHYTPLHYITLHYTTLPSTTLHYITLHSTTLQLQLRLHNYTPLHSTTLKLHYTPLHYTTLHYTPLHSTTLHYTTLHWMTLHHR